MGGLKAMTLAAAGTLLALGATAQGRPDGAGGNGPAQAGSDPIAGAYISHYTVDFIDGTPCQILVDLGFVETCSTSQMVMLNADGTVHTSDNNASRGSQRRHRDMDLQHAVDLFDAAGHALLRCERQRCQH